MKKTKTNQPTAALAVVDAKAELFARAKERPLTHDQRARLKEQEQIVRENSEGFIRTGRALMTIRDEELFLGTHDDFNDYVYDTFNLGHAQAGRFIDAVPMHEILQAVKMEVEEKQTNGADQKPLRVPTTESALREAGMLCFPPGPDGKRDRTDPQAQKTAKERMRWLVEGLQQDKLRSKVVRAPELKKIAKARGFAPPPKKKHSAKQPPKKEKNGEVQAENQSLKVLIGRTRERLDEVIAMLSAKGDGKVRCDVEVEALQKVVKAFDKALKEE